MIKIGIVDDHKILIDGLTKIINAHDDMSVTHSYIDGNRLIAEGCIDVVDIWLLDIEMKTIDGIDLSKYILEHYPNTKIMMLTMYNDVALACRLREIGVKGFLHKTAEEKELHRVIKEIVLGKTHFDILKPSGSENTCDDVKIFHAEKIKQLSERELEILKRIVEGNSNAQIGELLHISPRTVDTHRTNIMRKLEVTNVASLVRLALKNGFDVS